MTDTTVKNNPGLTSQTKIYVAGHRGLVGSAIVRSLEAGGCKNLVLRTHQELDLIDQSAVQHFFEQEQPEIVVLAAAKVGGILANSMYPGDFIYENLLVQSNIIHWSRKTGVERLLFLGSSCIYPKLAPQPMPESCLLTGELEPTNDAYAVAKIAGIKMCQAYHKQYGFDAISAMPTNLYGPNDNFDLENSHVLPALIRKFHLAKLAQAGDLDLIRADENRYGKIPEDILKSLGIERSEESELRFTHSSTLTPQSCPQVILWGSGSPCREFLHVDDMADASLFLMQLDPSQLTSHPSRLFNVGVGSDVTIRDLAELVQRIVGFDGEVIWDASKPDGTPRKLMDVSRIRKLGWQSRVGLEEGIRSVYSQYCQ